MSYDGLCRVRSAQGIINNLLLPVQGYVLPLIFYSINSQLELIVAFNGRNIRTQLCNIFVAVPSSSIMQHNCCCAILLFSFEDCYQPFLQFANW
jgi:hypothetical protein